MKIMYVIDSLRRGGKERRLLELIKYLKSNSEDININLLVLYDLIEYPEIFESGIEITVLDKKNHSEIKTLSKFLKEIKRVEPDIIHSWIGIGSFYSSIAKVFNKFFFINAMITSAPVIKPLSKIWFFSRFSFLFSDIIVSNSQAGLKAYSAPEIKSAYIYNGFNSKRLENLKDIGSVRAELNIKTKFIVGMVATFSDKKDYRTYLNCANQIISERADVSFICVGDGLLLDQYKKEFAEIDRIIFTGEQKDVESIVNIFDIGVLCTFGESLSNSILEYMALGKPVVTTDRGGNKEIVEDNVSGFLYEHKNIEDYKVKILTLLDDNELRKRMGNRSKEIVKEKFSIENMSHKTCELYKKVLK